MGTASWAAPTNPVGLPIIFSFHAPAESADSHAGFKKKFRKGRFSRHYTSLPGIHLSSHTKPSWSMIIGMGPSALFTYASAAGSLRHTALYLDCRAARLALILHALNCSTYTKSTEERWTPKLILLIIRVGWLIVAQRDPLLDCWLKHTQSRICSSVTHTQFHSTHCGNSHNAAWEIGLCARESSQSPNL
jgi:hypothetical protein